MTLLDLLDDRAARYANKTAFQFLNADGTEGSPGTRPASHVIASQRRSNPARRCGFWIASSRMVLAMME
jgi:hypothetical protein